MKAEFRETIGLPGLQVVVTAETDVERLLIRQFVNRPQKHVFHLHGWVTQSDRPGCNSFNFGWVELRPSRWKRFLRKLFGVRR